MGSGKEEKIITLELNEDEAAVIEVSLTLRKMYFSMNMGTNDKRRLEKLLGLLKAKREKKR